MNRLQKSICSGDLLKLCLVSVMVLAAGCQKSEQQKNGEFLEYLEPEQMNQVPRAELLTAAEITPESKETLSLKTSEMTLLSFTRYLADEKGLTVVSDQKSAELQISVDVVDQPVEDVLHLVARQIGKSVAKFGSAYIIGDIKDSDVGILTAKIGRYDIKEVELLVKSTLTGAGKIVVLKNGQLVVTDKYEGLRRVAELVDTVNQAKTETWIVQLYLARIDDSNDKEASLGTELEFSYKLARTSAGESTSGLVGTFDATAILRGSKSFSEIKQAPLLQCVDGQEAKLHSGRTVPVPRRTISDTGYSVIEGYDQVKDGLQVSVIVRGGVENSGLLTVDLSLSSITGYVESSPILHEDTLTTAIEVMSGGVYLLGSLRLAESSEEKKGYLSWGKTRKKGSGTLEIYAKVYKL